MSSIESGVASDRPWAMSRLCCLGRPIFEGIGHSLMDHIARMKMK